MLEKVKEICTEYYLDILDLNLDRGQQNGKVYSDRIKNVNCKNTIVHFNSFNIEHRCIGQKRKL